MDEFWDGYAAFVGDDALLVDLDERAIDPASRRELPALIRVEVEIIAPDEQGLPGPAEARLLDREEDRLRDLLEEVGGWLLARTTCRGIRELFLALPEAGRADFALRKWARKLEQEVTATPLDEGWDFVERHVLPGPAERLWMTARDAVFEALEAGADLEGTGRLVVEGRPDGEVPLDPFAIVAALGEEPGTWRLET